MSRPLLYLDVDGVLNVDAYAGPDYDDCRKWLVPDIPQSVIVPSYIAPNFRRLYDRFEIVWCTAWLGKAHAAWRHELGLPAESFEYIDYKIAKMPELLRHAGNRRWAYVDDAAAVEVGALLGKYIRKMSGGYWEEELDLPDDFVWPNGRVFYSDARRGLDDQLTDEIVAFADS